MLLLPVQSMFFHALMPNVHVDFSLHLENNSGTIASADALQMSSIKQGRRTHFRSAQLSKHCTVCMLAAKPGLVKSLHRDCSSGACVFKKGSKVMSNPGESAKSAEARLHYDSCHFVTNTSRRRVCTVLQRW